MNETGHCSVQMVRQYIREGSLFRENSGGGDWGCSWFGLWLCDERLRALLPLRR